LQLLPLRLQWVAVLWLQTVGINLMRCVERLGKLINGLKVLVRGLREWAAGGGVQEGGAGAAVP
jgi:hypothetical protein